MGRYLSVDSFGNVLCESEERDAGSRFQISIAEDGSGRWALRNESRGYFLGGTPDKLVCTAKAPSKGEFWTVHLAARPQVCVYLVFTTITHIIRVYILSELVQADDCKIVSKRLCKLVHTASLNAIVYYIGNIAIASDKHRLIKSWR